MSFQIPPPPGGAVPQQRVGRRRRILPRSHRRADPAQRLWREEVSDEGEEHEGGGVGSAGRNVRVSLKYLFLQERQEQSLSMACGIDKNFPEVEIKMKLTPLLDPTPK